MGALLSSHRKGKSVVATTSEPLDIARVVQLLGELNKAIKDFSETYSIPSGEATPSSFALANRPYFKLLTAINICLHHYVFLPFHPCLTPKENERCSKDYDTKFGSESPIVVADCRAQKFTSINRRKGQAAIYRTKRDIAARLLTEFRQINPSKSLPPEAHAILFNIVDLAYNWNTLLRSSVGSYLCEPFLPPIGSVFNDTLASFCNHHGNLERARVEAIVSMGVKVSELREAVGTMSFTVPDIDGAKACVLLDVPKDLISKPSSELDVRVPAPANSSNVLPESTPKPTTRQLPAIQSHSRSLPAPLSISTASLPRLPRPLPNIPTPTRSNSERLSSRPKGPREKGRGRARSLDEIGSLYTPDQSDETFSYPSPTEGQSTSFSPSSSSSVEGYPTQTAEPEEAPAPLPLDIPPSPTPPYARPRGPRPQSPSRRSIVSVSIEDMPVRRQTPSSLDQLMVEDIAHDADVPLNIDKKVGVRVTFNVQDSPTQDNKSGLSRRSRSRF